MGTHDDILVRPLAGDDAQHVGHVQHAMCALLQAGDGVGVYLPACSFLLPLLGIGFERLEVAVAIERADIRLFEISGQIACGHTRAVHTRFATLQLVVGQKTHNGLGRSTVDALQTPFDGGLCMDKGRAAQADGPYHQEGNDCSFHT